jgi:hypothetical protein
MQRDGFVEPQPHRHQVCHPDELPRTNAVHGGGLWSSGPVAGPRCPWGLSDVQTYEHADHVGADSSVPVRGYRRA